MKDRYLKRYRDVNRFFSVCLNDFFLAQNQILTRLNDIIRNLPKITRSISEPFLHSQSSDDFMGEAICPSPKTPINSGYSAFPFYITANI